MLCPECSRGMERTEDGALWVCTRDGAAVSDPKRISARERNLEHVRRARAALEAGVRRAELKRERVERDGPHLHRVA